jgi:hypothetical protein
MAVHVYPVFTNGDRTTDPVPTGKWAVCVDSPEGVTKISEHNYGAAVDKANKIACEQFCVCVVNIHAAFCGPTK